MLNINNIRCRRYVIYYIYLYHDIAGSIPVQLLCIFFFQYKPYMLSVERIRKKFHFYSKYAHFYFIFFLVPDHNFSKCFGTVRSIMILTKRFLNLLCRYLKFDRKRNINNILTIITKV